MFSCWMYFYEIFNQNKDKQHSISILLITYKFLNTKSRSTCSLVGKKGVWVGECASTPWGVTTHLLWSLPLENLLTRLDLLSVVINSLHWPQTLMAVYLHHQSAPGFFVLFFFFKQLFETTTGILSIISWKFVVVCLKYNWLYTIVLTFQTALSTFILITHLCIDFFSFKNACCERHRYPVCLMWKENVFCL